jgi:p-hydroxybenzoate 3-monooxygenase
MSDVLMLSQAFNNFYIEKSEAGIDGYLNRALQRMWKAERFS